MKKIAIIFAAGSGTRMNSVQLPKPFLKVHDIPIIIHTVRWFQNHEEIDEIIVVCAKEWVAYARETLLSYNITKASVVEGGSTAIDSQYRGICAARETTEEAILLMHDGVRPLINSELITNCIRSVEANGSAITVAKANETVLTVDSEKAVSSVLNRGECRLGRAPQCFYMSKLLQLHSKARPNYADAIVDSASLFRYYGENITTVDGPSENIKLTTPSDYYYFKSVIDAKESLQFSKI